MDLLHTLVKLAETPVDGTLEKQAGKFKLPLWGKSPAVRGSRELTVPGSRELTVPGSREMTVYRGDILHPYPSGSPGYGNAPLPGPMQPQLPSGGTITHPMPGGGPIGGGPIGGGPMQPQLPSGPIGGKPDYTQLLRRLGYGSLAGLGGAAAGYGIHRYAQD